MKDIYGNEYVRPAACSHLTCPPWQCLQQPIPISEPMPSPEELEQAEKDRREGYRAIADGLRSTVRNAPTASADDELQGIVSDLDLMAEGRMTETAGWRMARDRDRAVEAWRREVRKARSERLVIGIIVGIVAGSGFLYASWGEFDREIPEAVVATLGIAALCTWLFKSLLNVVLGLPGEPTLDRSGARRHQGRS